LVPFFVGVLADEAENIAAAHDDVLLAKILDKEECEALKMGAYLGVAAASTNPPKFIHLRYTPPSGDVKTKLAIVGKGLTFDRCIIQHTICIILLLSNG
jgi:leucyl aminopeptidase